MNDRIHRHLDGESAADALAAEDRAEADAWDRMLAAFRIDAPPAAPAPAWLEDRVMAEIADLPARGPLGRMWQWLVRPAPVRVSPLSAGLVAAALALVILIPGTRVSTGPTPVATEGGAAPGDGPAESVVYVQFVLEAPGARTVSVAGDFTDWEPAFALQDVDGDGVWTGRVPVRPGVHAYMFLVDDAQWRTDPLAERYQDDGFGNRNAVVAVAAGA